MYQRQLGINRDVYRNKRHIYGQKGILRIHMIYFSVVDSAATLVHILSHLVSGPVNKLTII